LKQGQLISSDQAVVGKVQHKKPCSDCPWKRDSLAGWLGTSSPEEWISIAHSETMVECLTLLTKQCAGLAIYRRNMCKSPRNPAILVLDSDREIVFSHPTEFMNHHNGRKTNA